MLTFVANTYTIIDLAMRHAKASFQHRRDYTAPAMELLRLEKPSSLLMTLSSDIEAWEDDEELTEEPFSL